jgi:predicted GIY-YIG superfamily endonuclease
MATVYIIRSVVNNEYYIGCTENFKRRIREHNEGYVAATKPFVPYQIQLVQEYKNLSDARKIELKLKKLKRKDYIEKIIREGRIKMDP